MSRETLGWLNRNVLRGFTGKRGKAWHFDASLQGELSNHYDGAIPVQDILTRLFSWDAIPSATYYDTPEGIRLDESVKTWIRSDTFEKLGAHSPGYHGHGYRDWLVDHLASLVGVHAQFANAGLLSGGSIAWAQIEMPDNVASPEGVVIRPFILATTSFDGSIASTFKPGYTDTVCDNTRDMFLREAGEVYRVKHTRNSKFNITDAATALNTLHLTAESALGEISALCKIDVTDSQWSAFVQAHVPIADDAGKNSITLANNKREALTGLYRTDMRVAPWAGTAWGVIQAVNTYGQHLSIVRGANRPERNMMNAVKGKVGPDDRAALDTLSAVMERELVAV